MDANKNDSLLEKERQRQELLQKMDAADLDKFIDEMAAKSAAAKADRKPFDFEAWCREIDQHPAFMKELKKCDEEGSSSEYSEQVQALQALKYDEDDPVECAAAHKEEGNRHFSNRHYRWAIDAYTKGIRLCCADPQLNSQLFANRAAANRRLGNLRSAVRDCIFSRRFQPDNFKPILRGAECLLELGQAGKCLEWIRSSQESTLKEEQRRQLDELQAKAEQQLVLEERDKRKKRAKESANKKAAQKLLDALKQRAIRHRPRLEELEDLTHMEVEIGQLNEKVSVHFDELGDRLVWPLLLQYTECAQTDFVAKCPEDVLLAEVLADVFEQPAEWDEKHEFCSENIRLFVPLTTKEEAAQLREIHPNRHTLGQVLEWPGVEVGRGLPVIQVYTREHLIKMKLKEVDEHNGIFDF